MKKNIKPIAAKEGAEYEKELKEILRAMLRTNNPFGITKESYHGKDSFAHLIADEFFKSTLDCIGGNFTYWVQGVKYNEDNFGKVVLTIGFNYSKH